MQVIYLILTQCPFLTSGFQVYLEGTGFLHKIFPPDFYLCLLLAYSFQASLVAQTVKNLPANAGDPGSIPGSERSPGGGNGHPLQFSCLENPIDRSTWQTTIHGVAESDIDTTERLNYNSNKQLLMKHLLTLFNSWTNF